MDKKKHILYIEDDLVVANSVERILRLKNDILDLDVVNNSEDAIEYFHKKHYDIIISDIRLPKVNGLEAIKNMKKENSEIYTVITSAFNEKEYLHEAIKTKIDKYLLKPIDLKELIETIEKYNEQKALKEKMFLQSKIDSISEAINNIAHQWRQPLNVITINASSVEMRFQLNDTVQKDYILKSMSDIMKQSNYLSKTLDDFRDFFQGGILHCKNTNIKEVILKVYSFMEGIFENNKIIIISNLEEVFSNINENQLVQILIIIFNNAIDAMIQNSSNNKQKLLFIDLFKEKEFMILKFKDNGGGIDDSIINKIFEPYFTTKHQSIGKGLGLYMVYQTITKQLKGEINVSNKIFTHKTEELSGVEFIIKLPISKKGDKDG